MILRAALPVTSRWSRSRFRFNGSQAAHSPKSSSQTPASKSSQTSHEPALPNASISPFPDLVDFKLTEKNLPERIRALRASGMSEDQIEVEIEALLEGELTPARIEAQVKLLLASGFDPDEVQARITAQLEARHEAQFEAHLDGLDASTKAKFKAQVETQVKSQPQTLLYSDQIISDIESKLASSVFHGRGVLPPFRHSLTHGIPVAMLHFRSFLPPLLAQFTHFASHAASSLGIPISTVKSLPTQRSMWTVLKGPFVHKKKQENFERRVHKRAIKAWDADPEVVDRWVKYLQRHALAGVGMRVTMWERAHVGIGRTRLENVKLQMNKSAQTDAEKVKALGQEIIRQELATPATTDAIVQMYTP